MKNITEKARKMYPAGVQNSLQFRTGFIEGAKWMKEQMIDEVWKLMFNNIEEISEELLWETTTPKNIADKIKRMLEK